MRPLRWIRLVCVLAVAAAVAAAGAATGARPFRPVIGPAAATPEQPAVGRSFSVAFRVRRSDTGSLLTRAAILFDVRAAGKPLRHADSFRGGTARTSVAVPEGAAGSVLAIALTVTANGWSSHAGADFRVPPRVKPAVSVADAQVEEGAAGAGATLSFPVTLSRPSARPVSVEYATADGSAGAGVDYAAASGVVTFAPGETQRAIDVAVIGDGAVEANETLTVALARPVEATVARGTATGTIVDDELVLQSPAPGATVSQSGDGSGCPAQPNRGSGLFVAFSWRSQLSGVVGYRLHVQHRGAIYSIVDATLWGRDSASYVYRDCGAFVSDGNLADWEWTVTAFDAAGTTLVAAQGVFAFAPCRLASGSPCFA